MGIDWKNVSAIVWGLMIGGGVAAWGAEPLAEVLLPTVNTPDAYYLVHSAPSSAAKEGYKVQVKLRTTDDFTLNTDLDLVGNDWGASPHVNPPAMTDLYPGSPPLYASILCGEDAEQLYPICGGDNNVLETVPLPSLNSSVELTLYPRTHVAVSGLIDKHDGDNSNNAGHIEVSVIKM